MIRIEEALKIVSDNCKPGFSEGVLLVESLHRILAEDVISDMDMPPFDKSAVDGYACRMSDLTNELTIIETIPAGYFPLKQIGKGQCSKIMTGAKVPDGADCVIMIEQTQSIPENKVRFTGTTTSKNISHKAEDIQSGQIVIPKGTLIKPQHIALLASVGYPEPKVYKKPRVVILSTGSELVEPHKFPGPAQIRNSNAWQLQAQVLRTGALPNYLGIIGDSEEETDLAIKKAIAGNDVIILTGGVSMGDFDFVPEILKKNNVDILFEKILTKPGMPTVFGVHNKSFVFGLPGNPVSSFLIFEILVKPFLLQLMGINRDHSTLRLPLANDFKRKKADRLGLIPAKINPDGELIPVEYHGSAHVLSICEADFIFFVPIGISEFKKGERVDVRQI